MLGLVRGEKSFVWWRRRGNHFSHTYLKNTAFCLEFNKMVFGEGTRISPESISTPGSVLYFALVTDGGPRLVTGWTRSSGWSMVSRPGCLAGATDPSRSHRPYQIVESEKILSRMIFQSQLWLLLLLSFWDYGHRVMTLCHQLFCRKIFQHEENEGGSSR